MLGRKGWIDQINFRDPAPARTKDEAAWRVVDPILGNATPVYRYAPNTCGPHEANALVGGEGVWHDRRLQEVTA
jgi:glucose-6-phosphate 1-dehydrogenase